MDETLQVISSDLLVQMQLRECKANEAQCLAAHLCQTRGHMLNFYMRFSDAMIAPLLSFRDRLVLSVLR